MQDTSALLSFFNIVFYLIAFFLVIFLVYFSTKIIARKTSYLAKSNKIKIIDFLSLSTNSKILIVEILDNIYILAVNNNQINIIDKLNKEDIDLSNFYSNTENKNINVHFDEILRNTKRLKHIFSNSKSKQSRNQADNMPFKDSQEDKE